MPRNQNGDQRPSLETAGTQAVSTVLHPPPPYATTMRAWERFVSGEPVPAADVGASVVASWQRSAQCGINPGGREAPVAAQGDSFERLRWRNTALLKAASGLFKATGDLLAGSRSIMLLTSQDGIVLDT